VSGSWHQEFGFLSSGVNGSRTDDLGDSLWLVSILSSLWCFDSLFGQQEGHMAFKTCSIYPRGFFIGQPYGITHEKRLDK